MMIIRQSILRQGRRIARFAPKSCTCFYASEVEKIEDSLQNHLRKTKAIQSQLQPLTESFVPPIDDKTGEVHDLHDAEVARKHRILEHQKTTIGSLGSTLTPFYQPHTLITNPPSPSDITLELLLASQSHLGHSTSLWNPMNSRYIFGIRQGIHIISLDVTASHLRRACRVVSGVAERGGLILFVGTRTGQARCVVNAARMAQGCHLFERWTPGSITNGHQILGRCKMKIVDMLDNEIRRSDITDDRPVLKPDLVVCLNPIENWIMLHECGLNAIPTIGIVDTDANPTWVTYPIPANDDSLRCVQVIAGVLGRAGEEGQARRLENARNFGGKFVNNSEDGTEVIDGYRDR